MEAVYFYDVRFLRFICAKFPSGKY